MSKKFLIPYLIISGVALVVMAVTIVFAWYTNLSKVGKIDADADGIAIEYKLDDGTANVTSYTVTNLTFFDQDAENELSYFLTSACVVEMDLKNIGTNAADYVLEYAPTVATVYDKTDKTISKAYVDCILTTTELTKIPSTVKTIEELKDSYTDETTGVTARKISGQIPAKTNNTLKVYMYLFGVQEIDTAKNEDFIENSFLFTITLTATQVSSDPDLTTTAAI